MGPPPILSGNAPPPLSGSLPGAVGGNAPPPLGALGAPPLALGALGASPLSAPPLSGYGAPPVLRPPSFPGLGPLPPAQPPAVAPPPLASNANPLAPVPQAPGVGPASMPGPILGPMPPLPNAAPPPVAPPVAPPSAAMPPLGAFGPAQPLAPVAPLNPLAGIAPVAEPPPNNPSPLLGAMPPLPAAPPVAPVSSDPFANVAPINNDPFANVAPINNDPFANVAPADPYGASQSGPYPPAQQGDPFAGAGMQNPFQRPAPQPRAPTAMAAMNAPPISMVMQRARAGTAMANDWQNPLPPALEQPTETRARLGGRAKLLVTQLDGTEQGEVTLAEGDNLIGREVGGLFAEDNLLSSRHATIVVQGNAAWVRDEGSRNGVYVRIPRMIPVELRDGDQFCFGRIILRFEQRPPAPGMGVDYLGLLTLVVGRDVDRGMFPYAVPVQGMTIGRTRADLRFPSDGWVSGAHCQISAMGSQVMLMDVGSANGTFVRIRGTRPLQHADALLMGQRIFHVQLQ